MNPLTEPLAKILDLNTRLFINCLDGIDDATAQKRIKMDTNSMTFIVCHLIDARYYLAGIINLKTENPFKELFEQAQSIDDFKDFPRLKELKSAWLDVSKKLSEFFPELATDELQKESSVDFPIDDNTVLGAIAFLIQHESYHIGQLGFLRKYLGFGAMKYK